MSHIVLHGNKRKKFWNFHCTIVMLYFLKTSLPSYSHRFSLLSQLHLIWLHSTQKKKVTLLFFFSFIFRFC